MTQDHRDAAQDDKRMTCVFRCDLRSLNFNPHTVDTPFGHVVVVSDGDLASEHDALEDKAARQEAAIERLGKAVEAQRAATNVQCAATNQALAEIGAAKGVNADLCEIYRTEIERLTTSLEAQAKVIASNMEEATAAGLVVETARILCEAYPCPASSIHGRLNERVIAYDKQASHINEGAEQ